MISPSEGEKKFAPKTYYLSPKALSLSAVALALANINPVTGENNSTPEVGKELMTLAIALRETLKSR